MFFNTLLIIAVCASSIMAYALVLIIGVKPWWSAQYLIPILGEWQQQQQNTLPPRLPHRPWLTAGACMPFLLVAPQRSQRQSPE